MPNEILYTSLNKKHIQIILSCIDTLLCLIGKFIMKYGHFKTSHSNPHLLLSSTPSLGRIPTTIRKRSLVQIEVKHLLQT